MSAQFEAKMAIYFKTTRYGLRRPAPSAELHGYVDKLPPEQHPRALNILKSVFDK